MKQKEGFLEGKACGEDPGQGSMTQNERQCGRVGYVRTAR